MYHDAYTLQQVEAKNLNNFNFVSGMVPFLLNLILDVSYFTNPSYAEFLYPTSIERNHLITKNYLGSQVYNYRYLKVL